MLCCSKPKEKDSLTYGLYALLQIHRILKFKDFNCTCSQATAHAKNNTTMKLPWSIQFNSVVVWLSLIHI